MQLEWVEVTNIAYIDEDKIFVGEVDVTWTDHTLSGTVGVWVLLGRAAQKIEIP